MMKTYTCLFTYCILYNKRPSGSNHFILKVIHSSNQLLLLSSKSCHCIQPSVYDVLFECNSQDVRSLEYQTITRNDRGSVQEELSFDFNSNEIIIHIFLDVIVIHSNKITTPLFRILADSLDITRNTSHRDLTIWYTRSLP